MAALAKQIDFDQVALPRKRFLLFGPVRFTAWASGLVGGTHDLDQSDEFHRVVRVQDLNPRLVNLQVFDLDDHRGIGLASGQWRKLFRVNDLLNPDIRHAALRALNKRHALRQTQHIEDRAGLKLVRGRHDQPARGYSPRAQGAPGKGPCQGKDASPGWLPILGRSFVLGRNSFARSTHWRFQIGDISHDG